MDKIVSIADMKISTNRDEVLITYALGSCLGITIYDPVAVVGGMVHVMLPQSDIDPIKAQKKPSMFVDTGVKDLFLKSYKLGAKKERLIVKVAGGASTKNQDDFFQIGKRNFIMLRKLLWKNGVLLKSYEVGGNISRTMLLNINNGDVHLKIKGKLKKL